MDLFSFRFLKNINSWWFFASRNGTELMPSHARDQNLSQDELRTHFARHSININFDISNSIRFSVAVSDGSRKGEPQTIGILSSIHFSSSSSASSHQLGLEELLRCRSIPCCQQWELILWQFNSFMIIPPHIFRVFHLLFHTFIAI